MIKKISIFVMILMFSVVLLSGCTSDVSYVKIEHLDKSETPQQPGERGTWGPGQKQGIGTANNDISKVWFTLSRGAISEVYYPAIDRANSKFLKFIVTDGKTFVSDETTDSTSKVERINDRSLAYRLVNVDKDGRYKITKEIFTDPRRNSLVMKVKFEALKGNLEDYKLYLLYSPHIFNQSADNEG
ncbi:MAG: glucan 1,4-alpha-glucosidase, partial [Caldanaerobacter sp.]